MEASLIVRPLSAEGTQLLLWPAFEELLKEILQDVQLNFEQDDKLQPVCIVFAQQTLSGPAKGQPSVQIFAPDMSSEETKDGTARFLHALCQTQAAFAYILAFEAWATYIDPTAPDVEPKRGEAIVVHVEHLANPEMLSLMAQITRDGDVPSLGAFEKMADCTCAGRFVGFIQPLPTPVASA